MDPKRQRIFIIGGALVLVIGILVAVISRHSAQEKITADTGTYYTGVRLNPNTGQWISGDNKVVPPPANATPAEIADAKSLAKNQRKMSASQ